MAVFRVEKNKGYTRYEQSPPAKQRTDAKSKGLALTDAFTSGKLGLYPCRTFPYQQRKYRFVQPSWSLKKQDISKDRKAEIKKEK